MNRKAILFVALLICVGGSFLAFTRYSFHINNAIGYMLWHEPYINRVFASEVLYVLPGSESFSDLVHNPDMDDRRWGTADFKKPAVLRISVPYTEDQLGRYHDFVHGFLSEFQPFFDGKREPSGQQMASYVHRHWVENRAKPSFDQTPFNQQAEKDRNPENLVFFFANYQSACGTISETSVALLRALGFRTRLMFMSLTKGKLIANHVFLEYFSPSSGKWVMFDAMENFIPTSNGVPMSAFEFFSVPGKSDQFRKGQTYGYHVPGSEIGFTKMGPVMTSYRLSVR